VHDGIAHRLGDGGLGTAHAIDRIADEPKRLAVGSMLPARPSASVGRTSTVTGGRRQHAREHRRRLGFADDGAPHWSAPSPRLIAASAPAASISSAGSA
jgi:hypothetical protein